MTVAHSHVLFLGCGENLGKIWGEGGALVLESKMTFTSEGLELVFVHRIDAWENNVMNRRMAIRNNREKNQ